MDGGYARPEFGWEVKVLPPPDGQVWVVFGSASEAIGVIAHCVNGRPRFEQRVQTIPGTPVPEPSLSTLSTPTMSPLSPVTQSLLSPAASPTLRDVPGPDGEPVNRFGQRWTTPASTPAATPSATSTDGTQAGPVPTAQPDAAEVSNYLALADQFCGDPAHASGWCQQWQALTPLERYTLVARWLEARHAADAGAASGVASGAPSGGENGGRDHWRNRTGATPAH